MSAARSIGQAVVGCAVGGGVVLIAAGRTWAHTTEPSQVGGRGTALSVTGHAVAPSLPALGLALLALAAAIIAGRGLMRRIVGVVVVFVGALAVGVSITARGDVSSSLEHHEVGAQGIAVHATANGWWVVSLLGAALATAVGVITVVRGRQWAVLGAKYDAPTAPPPTDVSTTTWDALDRGEDPTA